MQKVYYIEKGLIRSGSWKTSIMSIRSEALIR